MTINNFFYFLPLFQYSIFTLDSATLNNRDASISWFSLYSHISRLVISSYAQNQNVPHDSTHTEIPIHEISREHWTPTTTTKEYVCRTQPGGRWRQPRAQTFYLLHSNAKNTICIFILFHLTCMNFSRSLRSRFWVVVFFSVTAIEIIHRLQKLSFFHSTFTLLIKCPKLNTLRPPDTVCDCLSNW